MKPIVVLTAGFLLLTGQLSAQVEGTIVGIPFAHTYGMAGDGISTIFTFKSGTLPPGLSFSNDNIFGSIKGTPVQLGTFSFVLQRQSCNFSDPANVECTTADQPFFIAVRAPCATISKREVLLDLNGGTGEITVAAEPGCAWVLSLDTSGSFGTPPLPFWAHLNYSYTTGTSAVVQYRADPSTYGRSSTFVVGDNLFTVSQRRTTKVFDDVSAASDTFDAINLMKQRQVTLGCSATPPLYCPQQGTTRGQAAALLIRALFPDGNFPFSQQPYFDDVPAGHPYFPYIQKLRDMDITMGCARNAYCPDRVLTHGEAAVFMVRAKIGTAPFNYSPTPWFSDVPLSHPYFSFIQKLVDLAAVVGDTSVTNGCGLGLFCPENGELRQEMAVLLMRTLFSETLP